MIIQMQNPNGGRRLTQISLYQDPQAECLAYRIGYLPTGEPLGIRIGDFNRIMEWFGKSASPRFTFRHWIIKKLGGEVVNN